jgi:hypothetical protein
MATAKHKKIDKASMISFAVNFCAVFSLIYVVALLLVANMLGDRRAAMAAVSKPLQPCSCEDRCASVPSGHPDILVSSSGAENAVVATLTVDDGGFWPKQVSIPASGAPSVKIENRGVNDHSFVIDELSVNSGPIKPGQAQTIILENISDDAPSYDFYSDTTGDGGQNFGGSIMIVR